MAGPGSALDRTRRSALWSYGRCAFRKAAAARSCRPASDRAAVAFAVMDRIRERSCIAGRLGVVMGNEHRHAPRSFNDRPMKPLKLRTKTETAAGHSAHTFLSRPDAYLCSTLEISV